MSTAGRNLLVGLIAIVHCTVHIFYPVKSCLTATTPLIYLSNLMIYVSKKKYFVTVNTVSQVKNPLKIPGLKRLKPFRGAFDGKLIM